MKAIILAAGEGVRMRPLTLEKPKPLIEVAGKPLLQHIWELLPDTVDEVILVIGYKGDMIREYFGESFLGRKIRYITQSQKLGTADAARLCLPYLQKGERFLLFYADDLHDKATVQKMLQYPLAMIVKEVPDPRRFGVVMMDANGRVIDIDEKPEHPKSNLVNVGLFVLDREVLEFSPAPHPNGEAYLTDMIGHAAKEREFYAVPTPFWQAIGYPEDIQIAERALEKRSV